MNDPVTLTPSQLISATKLARKLSEYLDLVRKHPLFITRMNEVEVVLLSLEDYRTLLKAQAQPEGTAQLGHLAQKLVLDADPGLMAEAREELQREYALEDK